MDINLNVFTITVIAYCIVCAVFYVIDAMRVMKKYPDLAKRRIWKTIVFVQFFLSPFIMTTSWIVAGSIYIKNRAQKKQ